MSGYNPRTGKPAVKPPERMNATDYRFYVVSPAGIILSGWSYREDAQDGRADMPRAERLGCRILTRRQLVNRGIDANDDRAWGLVDDAERTRMTRALAAGLAGMSLSESLAYADQCPACAGRSAFHDGTCPVVRK